MRVTIVSLREESISQAVFAIYPEFFHHSRLCTRNPRCMKCAGPHRSEMPKPKDTPPKCLCNGLTANFTGCQNPVNRRTFSEAPENAWADPAIFAKIKIPPNSGQIKSCHPIYPKTVQLSSNANPSQKFPSNRCLK
ncbi:hypothetical protein AVEN_242096-1 [Araneus ventricosus]|uniref:Uncharacterized protein n=1 Tax=Araneus ventricosus TaxID=182803 RepID=A0A4Y2SJQ4_ARAVE|nr:hypothetical protein AVEN_242096-1 [Araneus ventricosus]